LTEDILAAVRETIPLSVVMEERIRALRDWAKLRTRPASTQELMSEETKANVADRLKKIAQYN
jgi:hypothetical protein